MSILRLTAVTLLTELTERNIQPAKRVYRHPVAGIDNDRRSLGLDHGGTLETMARPQRVERIDRHLVPAAKEGLPGSARRTGGIRRRRPQVLSALRYRADRGYP